jgi:hypothetical protein
MFIPDQTLSQNTYKNNNKIIHGRYYKKILGNIDQIQTIIQTELKKKTHMHTHTHTRTHAHTHAHTHTHARTHTLNSYSC